MTFTADLYWSFRSPFSYLVTGELKDMMRHYDFKVRVKPVYPLVIRVPDFFEKADPRFFSYLLKDVERTAQMHGWDFGKADPDPIVMQSGRKRAAAEQPYIYRLTRIAAAASQEADIFPLIDEVGRLIWSGKVKGWDQGEHLSQAAARAGFDLAALDEKAVTDADALDAIIQQNQHGLEAAGHWGVPTMVYNGEPFFNQDRAAHLLWRMQQDGLQKR